MTIMPSTKLRKWRVAEKAEIDLCLLEYFDEKDKREGRNTELQYNWRFAPEKLEGIITEVWPNSTYGVGRGKARTIYWFLPYIYNDPNYWKFSKYNGHRPNELSSHVRFFRPTFMKYKGRESIETLLLSEFEELQDIAKAKLLRLQRRKASV